VDPRLARVLDDCSQVVFVCSGNAVRSAFAHVYAEHLGLPRTVRSLATRYHNATLFAETARALAARGVGARAIAAFRSEHVDTGLARIAPDAVLFGMRAHHLPPLCGHRERAFLLPAVLGESDEIADPVEEGADFEATFARIERCVTSLAALLAARGARER
jgi:protein-tyrosine-phosphatase